MRSVKALAPARIKWAIDLLELETRHHVFEIGYGSGIAAQHICAKLGRGSYYGVDQSAAAAKTALDRNGGYARGGRAIFLQAPFDAARHEPAVFDRVLAVNVNAFWADEGEIALTRPIMLQSRCVLVFQPPAKGSAQDRARRESVAPHFGECNRCAHRRRASAGHPPPPRRNALGDARLPALSAHALEEACINDWPALRRTEHAGWLQFATMGRSWRVNSVWPLAWRGDASAIDAAIDACAAWAASHHAALAFKLADGALAPPDLARRLARRGFAPRMETLVMTRPLQALPAPAPDIEMHAAPSDDYIAVLRAASPSAEDFAERSGILARMQGAACFPIARLDGEAAAIGLGRFRPRSWGFISCARRRTCAARAAHARSCARSAPGAAPAARKRRSFRSRPTMRPPSRSIPARALPNIIAIVTGSNLSQRIHQPRHRACAHQRGEKRNDAARQPNREHACTVAFA